MSISSTAADPSTEAAIALLENCLRQRLTQTQWQWLQSRLQADAIASDRDLHISMGMVPRKLGKADLAPDKQELAAASKLRRGWDPQRWSIDSSARVLLLLKLALSDNHRFADFFKQRCQSADLGESIGLYQGLPFYPHGKSLDFLIGEGLRSNVRAVFESIAHRNPYPADYFPQLRWNHMVLKALFIGSELQPMQGLDERANRELALILRDFAHERWAASRPVPLELWRCIGPFADGELFSDLQRALAQASDVYGPEREKQAVLLAIARSPDPRAGAVLEQHPQVTARIDNGQLSWASICDNSNKLPEETVA